PIAASTLAPVRLADVATRSAETRAALFTAAETLSAQLDRACDAGVATDVDPALDERLRRDGAKLAAITTPLLATTDAARAAPLRALGLLLAGDSTAGTVARDAASDQPSDRGIMWILGEALLRSNDAKERAEGFAILRDLAPIDAVLRDRFWWRAQAAMLETLAVEAARGSAREDARGDTRRVADLVARANRLATIDAELGGPDIARRIEAARRKVKTPQNSGGKPGGLNGGPNGGPNVGPNDGV
ncbi:MAG: hypothetical protein ACKO3W_00805, partial [bacterium]